MNNKIIEKNGHFKIIINYGGKQDHCRAIIDFEDLKKVGEYSWWLWVKRRSGKYKDKLYTYVATKHKKGKKWKTLYLHHLIMGKKDGYLIDHINRDSLDNRKCNLRFATRAENTKNSSSWELQKMYKKIDITEEMIKQRDIEYRIELNSLLEGSR